MVNLTAKKTSLHPHSVSAEQAVIGGLMLDNSKWPVVRALLTEGDFYGKQHRYLFRAIHRLLSGGQPADILTVSDYLEANNCLEVVGGLFYVGTLAKDTPSAANIASYANIVREKSLLRKLQKTAGDYRKLALNPNGRTANDLIKEFRNEAFALHQESLSRG